jgi:hypothetical protein
MVRRTLENQHPILNSYCKGKIARIGPQTLLASDVEYVRRINALRSPYSRSDWYKGGRFVPNEDTLLSMTDDYEHKTLRAKMAPGVTLFPLISHCLSNARLTKRQFNTKVENERVEKSIDGQLTIMLDLIKAKYISNVDTGEFKPLDWGYLASYFGIDSITDIAFSEALGDLKEDADKFNFLHNMESNLPTMSVFSCYNWMLKLLQSRWVEKYVAPSPDDKSPFGNVMG